MHTLPEEKPTHQWIIGYSKWISRRRWWVMAISIIVTLASGFGAIYLRVDSDTRIFFNPESQQLKALENLEDTYSKTSHVIIVLAPHSGDVFTRPMLSLVADVTKLAWKFPDARHVASVTNYQYSYGEKDDFFVKELIPNPTTITDDELKRARLIALNEPALVDLLISKGADVTAISVTIARADGNRSSATAIANAAHELAQQIRLHHKDVDVYLTGAIMADAALAEAAENDIRHLVPLSIILVVGTLWIGLRSAYSVIATMTIVLMSMIVAAGAAGWLGLVMNPMTVGAPILSMTLAIADCVHLLAGAAQLQRKGYSAPEAFTESLRVNWTPVLMTSVTTAVAFLAVNFADSPPINDVGNIVAVGVVAAWIFSVTFLPALLTVLPAPKQLPILSDPSFLVSISRQVIKYRTPIIVVSIVLVSGLAAGMHRMIFDDDLIKYFSNDYEFRRDTDFMQNRLTGLHGILYSVPSGREGGVTDPSYLNTLDAFADWFKTQEHVTHVSTFADIMKRLNRDMHGNDLAFYRAPDTQALASQYLLLYEMSLSRGEDLSDRVDIAKSSSLVIVLIANISSDNIRRLATEGENWLKKNGIAADATGISVMYSTLTAYNIKAMMLGVAVELISISFLMIFMLRNVKIGLISLVPNLVPAIMAFGLWGWIGYEVNLSVSAVAAITFGIIVDDTIHSLSKYMRARRELGMNTLAAVEYVYVAAGDPMILTGLTLILGFGALSLSGFAVSHQMGLLSASIIAVAILADLILLPPLLILLDRAPSLRTWNWIKSRGIHSP